MNIISPSILSADQCAIGQAIEMLHQSQADWIHFDVMDGVFVPNISFGFPLLKTVRALTDKPLDVHLMIVEPERYISQFRDAGADILTIHYEASRHLNRSVEAIRAAGMKAGVALNPHSPVELLIDILPVVDMVLIMSVNPGFGGQKFIPQTYSKLTRLCRLREELNPTLLVQVDGGVDLSNRTSLTAAGADVLVAGNAIFGSADPKQMIAQLKADD